MELDLEARSCLGLESDPRSRLRLVAWVLVSNRRLGLIGPVQSRLGKGLRSRLLFGSRLGSGWGRVEGSSFGSRSGWISSIGQVSSQDWDQGHWSDRGSG